MEWVIGALIIWFLFFRSKGKKVQRLSRELIKENQALIENQQQIYNKYLASLPELQGDGSFSQEVVGELAYQETLNNFAEYLKKEHPGEDEILVLVELEPTNSFDKNAVRLEAASATVGYIPRQEAEQFGQELKTLGGKATCSAKFLFSDLGHHGLRLDVERPLRTKP